MPGDFWGMLDFYYTSLYELVLSLGSQPDCPQPENQCLSCKKSFYLELFLAEVRAGIRSDNSFRIDVEIRLPKIDR